MVYRQYTGGDNYLYSMVLTKANTLTCVGKKKIKTFIIIETKMRQVDWIDAQQYSFDGPHNSSLHCLSLCFDQG